MSGIIYVFIEISSRLPTRSLGYRLLVIYLLVPFNYAFLTLLTVVVAQTSYSKRSLLLKLFPSSMIILTFHIGITVCVWTFCILEIISPGMNGAVSSIALSRMLFNLLFFDIMPLNQENFLWRWISAKCPDSLDYDHCYKPFYFSPSNCAADVHTCSIQHGNGFACPYFICQEAVSQVTSSILIVTFIVISMILTLSCCILYLTASLRPTISERSILPSIIVPISDNPFLDYSQQKFSLDLLPHSSELAYIVPGEVSDAEGALLRIDLNDYAEFVEIESSS